MTENETRNATGSTTQAGIPAVSDRNSLTVGNDGPVVLHDAHLIETMQHFNRMNIPERRPHAKGGGAFGTFEVTEDVSRYTKADFLQPGKKTEMLARFSTVAGELGSPDTWRDVRGFALKFYTEEGNFDMVGNNTPIFFVRDPMKFQHFIRSQKRLPNSGLRDGTMQWDFWTNNPESAHQVTYLMGQRGLPKTWRHMNGYSSHTYSLVNAQGERFWVKWHFLSHQGVEFLTNSEAERQAGANADTIARISSRRSSAESIRPGTALPDHALRGSQELSVQPVRPDQGLAQEGLSAHQGRHDDSEPQSGELLRPDRAGCILTGQYGPGHREFPGQDAARSHLLLSGRPALSRRHQLSAAPGEQAHQRCSYIQLRGRMWYEHSGNRSVYAPNSFGDSWSDEEGPVENGGRPTAN